VQDGDLAWAEGSYLGERTGISVTRITRVPRGSEPPWHFIDVTLDVMTFKDGNKFDLPIDVTTNLSRTCYDETRDCVHIRWGGERQFEAVLTSTKTTGDVLWPRFKAWPTHLTFPIPANVVEADLFFGEHVMPLDLRGQTGSTPSWNFRSHYNRLEPGTTLLLNEGQSIRVDGIVHNADTGDLELIIRATNTKEDSDFYPRVVTNGGRASDGGTVFDGTSRPVIGWRAVSQTSQGGPLAPGQSGTFPALRPRVTGAPFDTIEHTELDRPDAMLIRLVADNAPPTGVSEAATTTEPMYVPYERTGEEGAFWFPDYAVANITMTPEFPTARDQVVLAFTVENQGPQPAAATTLRFDINNEEATTIAAPATEARGSRVIEILWTATADAQLLTGIVDPGDLVQESSIENNTEHYIFLGGALPGLVVQDVTFSDETPVLFEKIQISVTVKNQRVGHAGASRVAGYLDSAGSVSFFMSFRSLNPGESQTSAFIWTVQPPSYHLSFIVDGFHDVPEKDETNNEAASTTTQRTTPTSR
jgi:hypothetical protein